MKLTKKMGRVATFAKYFHVFMLEPLWPAKKSLTNKRPIGASKTIADIRLLANKRLITG